MTNAIQQIVDIDAQSLTTFQNSTNTPGTGQDVLLGNLWAPHFDYEGNVVGSVVADAGNHDELRGGPGDDVLMGGIGDDTISTGGGSDFIIGGSGNDTYVVGPGTGAVQIMDRAGEGNDVLRLPAGIDPAAIQVYQPKLGELAFVVPNPVQGQPPIVVGMKDPRLGNGEGVEGLQIGDKALSPTARCHKMWWH
jgi:RTX toxins and related Ca2+-binding proteins